MNMSTKAMPASRMHITSSNSQPAPQFISFKAQPPRPPCWQDFIGKSIDSSNRLDTNVSITISASSDSDKKHKSHRSKHKKATNGVKGKGLSGASSLSAKTKLKRTRSEPCIAEKEIPAEAVYARLTSKQLSRQSIDEAKKYLEDTYHKCSQWLAQISPGSSIPLDDTDFEVGSGDIITCEDETRKDLDYHAKRHSLAFELDNIPE